MDHIYSNFGLPKEMQCANCMALAKLADEQLNELTHLRQERDEVQKEVEHLRAYAVHVDNEKDALAVMVGEMRGALKSQVETCCCGGQPCSRCKDSRAAFALGLPQAAKIAEARKEVCEAADHANALNEVDAPEVCAAIWKRLNAALVELRKLESSKS